MNGESAAGDATSLAQRLAMVDRCERLWAFELSEANLRADALASQLQSERADYQRLTTALEDTAAASHALHAAYEQSLSWRITRPLRYARRLMRQRGA